MIFFLFLKTKKNSLSYNKVKFTELKELAKTSNNFLVEVTTPLISHLLMTSFFVLALSWVIIAGKSSFYIFPLLILLTFFLYKLWVLFEPINIIKINKGDGFFVLISRNLLKRLFAKSNKIYFNTIEKFEITEGPEVVLEGTRFIISAVLKDSSNIFFSSTSKKTMAKEMVDSLSQTIVPYKKV